MRRNNLIVFIIILMVLIGSIQGQEIEPRIYANVPAKMNLLGAYYAIAQGNIFTDPALPLQDFKATTHSGLFTYIRTISLFGKLWKFQAIVPYSHLMGDVKISGRDTSGIKTGFADARFRLAVNLIGSPPLARDEFVRYNQETIVGVSLLVMTPTGQYDPSKRVNLSSNRWGFKPEVGFSQRWDQLYFEAYAGIWFFTDNTEFLEVITLQQEPVYTFQWHLVYTLKSGPWFALTSAHVNGGRVILDDLKLETYQDNWRLGAVFSYPFSKQHSIRLMVHTGIYTIVGSDFDVLSVGYQYLW